MGKRIFETRRVGKPTGCIVCQGELTLFGPYAKYTFKRCVNCGTIQLSPMPDEAEMATAYENEYIAHRQAEEFADPEKWRGVSRTYRHSIIDALKDHHVNGLVVDYGSGWGHLVEAMIRTGFKAEGVDISEAQIQYAQSRGLPVHQDDIHSTSRFQNQAAAVTMLAVFEHLINHAAVLNSVHCSLKDGGVFVTLHPTAPAVRFFGNLFRLGRKQAQLPDLAGALTAPWHAVLFSIEGTRQIVSRHGFELLEIRPAPQGRLPGLLGLVQIVMELVNKAGWALFKTRWPLITTHIFVFRKVSVPAAS